MLFVVNFRLRSSNHGIYLRLRSKNHPVYPIDVVKTRMQNINYKNGFYCFNDIIKKEGIQSFYKGSITQLIGIGPEKAIKFLVNDIISSSLYDSQMNKIIAGACAGASQVIVTNPISNEF